MSTNGKNKIKNEINKIIERVNSVKPPVYSPMHTFFTSIENMSETEKGLRFELLTPSIFENSSNLTTEIENVSSMFRLFEVPLTHSDMGFEIVASDYLKNGKWTLEVSYDPAKVNSNKDHLKSATVELYSINQLEDEVRNYAIGKHKELLENNLKHNFSDIEILENIIDNNYLFYCNGEIANTIVYEADNCLQSQQLLVVDGLEYSIA